MDSLETYRKFGKDLFHKLHLSTYPVAIKYIESRDEIPENALVPSVLGKKLALCQAFTMARRNGATVAMTAKDNFCVPGTALHQWGNISAEDFIESQVRQGWHKDIEAEKKRFESFSKRMGPEHFSKPVKYIGLISAPLADVAFIPDSVLIYCDVLQFNHIIHALSYEHKYVPTSSFEGFEESCVKGGLLPFLKNKPQVVIPGAGDRVFGGISDHELGVGLPAGLTSYVLENLFKTGGKMNMGYPQNLMVPMDLNEDLTPGFKYLWDQMSKKNTE